MPACLPKSPIGSESCLTSGWGHTNPHDLLEKPSGDTVELKAAKLEIQSPEECEDAYNSFSYLENVGVQEFGEGVNKFNVTYSEKYRKSYLKNFEICVKGAATTPCQGDSGGPLICNGMFYI